MSTPRCRRFVVVIEIVPNVVGSDEDMPDELSFQDDLERTLVMDNDESRDYWLYREGAMKVTSMEILEAT